MTDRPRLSVPVRLGVVLALAAGCAATFLAGCKSEPKPAETATAAPSKGSLPPPPELTAPQVPLEPMSPLGFRLEWRSQAVVVSRHRVKFLDAWNDLIVVQDDANTMTAIEPQTGRSRWSADIGADLLRFIGNTRDQSNNIVACSETDALILNPGSGELTGRQRFAELANTPPMIVGNILLVGCFNGQVLGHNLISGYKQWAYQLNGRIDAPMVRTGRDVVAVSSGGDVAVLSPARGGTIGNGKIQGRVDNAPVADDRTVYIAGADQSIWAFASEGGELRWRVRTAYPLVRQPALHEGRLYVTIPKEGIACLEAATGARVWTAANLDATVVGINNGRLVTWDGKAARTLDAVTGDVVETVEIPNCSHFVMDKFVDGNLYLASPRGELRKYSAKK
ncbi:MAG TPA: PQQ-binding-like beta-propeller repeat protein [Phycisphaerales bacterium]|nr:PQQ-binding-like beta-propeller repeat protein [Phycisphaerales bacterium]